MADEQPHAERVAHARALLAEAERVAREGATTSDRSGSRAGDSADGSVSGDAGRRGSMDGPARGARRARGARAGHEAGALAEDGPGEASAGPWSLEGVAADAEVADRRPRRSGSGRGRRRPAHEPPAQGAAATDAEPEVESVARTVAIRLLTSSPRSRAQLAEAMARKDVPEVVADRVLDRFEEVGLVDDAEYAAMLVRTRHAERGLAGRALATELRRKGIDPETAAVALQEVDRDDEEEAARRLVEKRLRAMGSLEPEVKRRRLVAMLARKGHAPGLGYRVVGEALAAEGLDDDDPDGPDRADDL